MAKRGINKLFGYLVSQGAAVKLADNLTRTVLVDSLNLSCPSRDGGYQGTKGSL
ncbi:MAG: hypothetical protein QME51_00170 [Planctomycetota bacterium]|nr:hypothetical protein [Planctomycetota bacterium]MDI6786774.1 hypothetical protein [Planctomycetota bacterium]